LKGRPQKEERRRKGAEEEQTRRALEENTLFKDRYKASSS
jgi:hypothetical protein